MIDSHAQLEKDRTADAIVRLLRAVERYEEAHKQRHAGIVAKRQAMFDARRYAMQAIERMKDTIEP